ncbi:MAG: hypothetical protein JSS02_27215, partial [Planctomycetes bacterium]|nr:hypothetical protein [Planctomycetota bacterium]
MLRIAIRVAALMMFTTAAQAGPLGTYYLTDETNFTANNSTLDAIRGNVYVQNASIYQGQEGPVAIVGGAVRTTGYYLGNGGGEYITAPDLNVSPSGNTWTNDLTGVVGHPVDAFFDGTSDGTYNYTLNYYTGDVIRTDLNWGGPGTVLFNVGAIHFGITYDRWHDTLWIQHYDTGDISEYSMTGTLLGTFSTPDGTADPVYGSTALA